MLIFWDIRQNKKTHTPVTDWLTENASSLNKLLTASTCISYEFSELWILHVFNYEMTKKTSTFPVQYCNLGY